MDKEIKSLAWIAAIALIVTVVLYFLFENYAVFEDTAKRTKLGGSVAFFIIFFSAELVAIKQLSRDNLAPIRKSLSGKWKYTASVARRDANEEQTFGGTATIQLGEEGKITIIGTTDGRAEVWDADEVVLTDSKLVYFFDVPLLHFTGVTNLRFLFNRKSPLNEMRGYWILSGQDGRGNIVFTRET
jgi:hypothetical protein